MLCFRFLTPLLTLFFLNAAPSWAELPALIPRAVIFGDAEKANVRISPNGKLLAYLAPDNGVPNIWVRTIGRKDDHVITSDRASGIRSFFWQEDSKHVLYGQDSDGNERWHIYQTDLQAKNTCDLTPFEGVIADIVAASAKFPDTMLIGLSGNGLDDVYRIDLNTGTLLPDTENPGDVASWFADHSLQVRAAQVTPPNGGIEISVRDGARAGWRTLLKWGPEECFGGIIGFTPDDKSLYVINSIGANTSRFLKVNLASGGSEVLAEDRNYDITDWLSNSGTGAILAVGLKRDRQEWKSFDRSLARDLEAIAKIHEGSFNIVSEDNADRKWIVVYEVDNGPFYYYLYDRTSRRATFLFSHRPALESYTLARMRPISFTARDGMALHGYLTLPVGVRARNLPMILKVHGGPWIRDVWGTDSETQWLANRGYAVLRINYRGSTGYGKAYLDAGDREWGGKMQDDLIDGRNWAVKAGYADRHKFCVMGASYGGYATLVALALTPDVFTCGVDSSGPTDLVTFLNNIPAGSPLKPLFTRRVGNPETEPNVLQSRSPLSRADQIQAPLLIAQGANDVRVKQAESDQIAEAIRKNGRSVEYIVFANEGHGLARADSRLKFYAAVESFLAKYLGGRVQPPSEAESIDSLLK